MTFQKVKDFQIYCSGFIHLQFRAFQRENLELKRVKAKFLNVAKLGLVHKLCVQRTLWYFFPFFHYFSLNMRLGWEAKKRVREEVFNTRPLLLEDYVALGEFPLARKAWLSGFISGLVDVCLPGEHT